MTTRNFECGFCLEVTPGKEGKEIGEDYPDYCLHCRIVSCKLCGAYIKVGSRFCYGCGTLCPEFNHTFADVGSFGCAYMETFWRQRNRNNPDKEYTYVICTGNENGEMIHKMTKWYDDARGLDLDNARTLTDEEIKKLEELRKDPEIKKEGVVIFKNGEIVEISDFHVKGGTTLDLAKYVEENYIFKGEKK